MAEHMRWWVIPGALVVLLRVVTLEGPRVEPLPEVAAATAAQGLVVLRDASGQASAPAPLTASAATTWVVSLPGDRNGQRGVLTIWRRLDRQREPTPWLVVRARVRSDATVPVVGLAQGRYDVEMVFGEGAKAARFSAQDAAVPGVTALRAAP